MYSWTHQYDSIFHLNHSIIDGAADTDIPMQASAQRLVDAVRDTLARTSDASIRVRVDGPEGEWRVRYAPHGGGLTRWDLQVYAPFPTPDGARSRYASLASLMSYLKKRGFVDASPQTAAESITEHAMAPVLGLPPAPAVAPEPDDTLFDMLPDSVSISTSTDGRIVECGRLRDAEQQRLVIETPILDDDLARTRAANLIINMYRVATVHRLWKRLTRKREVKRTSLVASTHLVEAHAVHGYAATAAEVAGAIPVVIVRGDVVSDARAIIRLARRKPHPLLFQLCRAVTTVGAEFPIITDRLVLPTDVRIVKILGRTVRVVPNQFLTPEHSRLLQAHVCLIATRTHA